MTNLTVTRPEVLMIAYFFPPLGGAGVQRSVKFAKYLPEYGWEPIVLTVAGGTHIAYDPSLLDDLPESLHVYRTWAFDPEDLRGAWQRWRGHGDTGSTPAARPSQAQAISRSDESTHAWRSWLAHLYLGLIPWVCVPDRKIGWAPYATEMGRRLLGEGQIRVLYSTSSPITSHLVALRLKRQFHIPWVADFRDLWVSFPGHTSVTPLHGRIERSIERRIVLGADRIIANTEASRLRMLQDYPDLSPDRVITILNGYDEDDFRELTGATTDTHFTLTYTGNLYGNRNPLMLFQGMRELFQTRPALREKLRLRLIGPLDPKVNAWVHEYDLAEQVECQPYLPHRHALEALSASDATVLIDAPEFNVNIPGKVFEYLRIGRPILALIADGATATLLRETGGARIVHPSDQGGIAAALETLVEQRATTTSGPDPNLVAQFERRVLTGQLAAVLNQVSG